MTRGDLDSELSDEGLKSGPDYFGPMYSGVGPPIAKRIAATCQALRATVVRLSSREGNGRVSSFLSKDRFKAYKYGGCER